MSNGQALGQNASAPGGNQQQVPQNGNNNAPQHDLSNDPPPFDALGEGSDIFDANFLDNADALDTFDFDSFLQNDDENLGGFDANFAFGGDAMGNGIEGQN